MDWEKYLKSEALEDYRKYVSPGKLNAYRLLGFNFIPTRREGVWVYDDKGNRFVNCRSSGGVFNFGHRPKELIDALKQALDIFDIGDHLLMSGARAALAKRLAELTPGDIQYTVFGVGGGEAVDLAIKLARAHTQRPKIISAIGGYHGHTGFALATGDEDFKKYFGPLAPGFVQVPFGDLRALEEEIDESTAAVIFETVPATYGIKIPPPEFFPGVRKLCDKSGAIMIIDEVQAGMGRTGRLWAIEEYGVVPDIMVMAKGLSGAVYPMSATCFRPFLNKFFEEHPFIHVSTMGGSEAGCVVTLKVLEKTSRPEFLAEVRRKSEVFAKGLSKIQERHPALVKEIRIKGLMIGIGMPEEKFGPLLTIALKKNGVIALFAHNDMRAMIIMPPLVISDSEIAFVLDALEKSFTAIEKSGKVKEKLEGDS